MRIVVTICFTVFTLNLLAQVESPDLRDLVRRSVQRDRLNANRAKDYTYVQRTETRDRDSGGRVVKIESRTFDVIMIGERRFQKLIAKNDKPLSEQESRKAREGLEKALRRYESKEGKPPKEDDDERDILQELPDAFLFTLVGPETVDGHAVWVVDAKPKPGYRGKAKRWELLTKFKGRLWIDQKELQWVRVEAETIAPVSFGWVLARLEPGAKLTFQQSRLNSELWLPSKATTELNARLGFKKLRNDTVVTWQDYRKYRADSRIVSAEEAPASSPPEQR
ncbi:MAG: hypothetical protein IPP47_11220 [Bryobacterales bacterium]|nr:hypothetical protein [Bryobacterales bacterium]